MQTAVVPSAQNDGVYLKAIPYEETTTEKPPIPIKTTNLPRTSHFRGAAGLRKAESASALTILPYRSLSKLHDDRRRDSGLATSSSTARESRTTLASDSESTPSIRHSPSIRLIPPRADTTEKAASRIEAYSPVKERSLVGKGSPTASGTAASNLPFLGILTEIPTGSFDDLTMPGQVEFSKRGSLLLGGRKANKSTSDLVGNGRTVGSRRDPKGSDLKVPSRPSQRVLSTDDEALSRKVRSMYQDARIQESDSRPETKVNGQVNGEAGDSRDHIQEDTAKEGVEQGAQGSLNGNHVFPSAAAGTSDHISNLLKATNEMAGGIEDWEDLHGGDVDRYGFIVPRKLPSQTSSINSGRPVSPDPPRLQRVSTLLQLASDTPRRKHSGFLSARSAKSPSRSTDADSARRYGPAIIRPMSSQSSYRSSNGQSRLRFASNHLPHNKARRCVDEAGDMLTLPPGLADIAEDREDRGLAYEMKKREWDREEKWRKMGKLVKHDKRGGGMVFEFDTKSSKVIERTWKGIPDKWRATAWHAFLTASAKKRRDFVPNEELIEVFKSLLDQSSPDDVQIDIDVPRTVNSHIMFRRRYRGGQRLLFRVLHCVSIYFPETGYVQGMAALAATLLCYFEEEMAFVMMVRLWQVRGLDRLYKAGFAGLMLALEEFERDWLRQGQVANKLVSLPDLARVAERDMLTVYVVGTWRTTYLLWHTLVSDAFQLLNTFPCSASSVGCFYAPRRSRLFVLERNRSVILSWGLGCITRLFSSFNRRHPGDSPRFGF